MAEGYIKLYRKLLNSPTFDNPNVLKVFLWCLLKATHQERDQVVGLQVVHLTPGQFVFGRIKDADELKMHPSSLYRIIQQLSSLGNLNINPNNKFSVVTIANWELYQGDDENASTCLNNKRTTDEQQMNTNKNVKNVKNNISAEQTELKGYLPLIDGTEYPVYADQIEKWEGIYPNVDVKQELRNMLGWLEGNPKKRKTKAGILRFVTGWLARAQERATQLH